MRDALRFSLQREFEAMAFYDAALDGVKDPDARAAIEFLSREERRHLSELSERFAREHLGGEGTERFLDELRTVSKVRGRDRIQAILSGKEPGAQAILRAAVVEEKRSEDLYRLNARTMPDQEARAFYVGLMKEEKEHIKTLKAVLRLIERGVVSPADLRVKGSRARRRPAKPGSTSPARRGPGGKAKPKGGPIHQ
jgi:rubrerythrin